MPPSCFADGPEGKTGIVGHLALSSALREAGIAGTATRAFADLLPDTRREAASMLSEFRRLEG